MNGMLSPSVAGHLKRLTQAMPGPWTFQRRGRICTWRAQPLGDPAGVRPPVIQLDRRHALSLSDQTHERAAWRKPIDKHQLIAHINCWAAMRTAQWEVLINDLGLPAAEQRQLLTALQRHEWSLCPPLIERIWSASLNRRLEVPIAGEPSDYNLLRWVLAARVDSEYRRRRRLARRHTRILVLGRVLMPPSHPLWPFGLRRLTEETLFPSLGYLSLIDSLLPRISHYPIDQAPQWIGPYEEFYFWARLQAHLPADLWPTEGNELQAAERLLRHLRPLFGFGLDDEDAFYEPVERERGLWFINQLREQHGGSWAAMQRHWRAEPGFNALMHGTLPRLREVLSAVAGHNESRLERMSEPLRQWTPEQWQAALLKWHAAIMPGGLPDELSWEPMLSTPYQLNGYLLGSPTSISEWLGLERRLQCDEALEGLEQVMAGQGQFLWLRSLEPDRLLAVVLISAGKSEPGEWQRQLKFFWTRKLSAADQSIAQETVQTVLASAAPLDWGLVEWREGWEATAESDALRLALARTMFRVWESITA